VPGKKDTDISRPFEFCILFSLLSSKHTKLSLGSIAVSLIDCAVVSCETLYKTFTNGGVEKIGLDTVVYVGVFVSYDTIRKVPVSEE
jgi:hypothetical protein